MSSQPHFGSIGSQQRAEVFCNWTNDLVARDTHLNVWMKHMKQTQTGTPELLTREVRAKQRRDMELAMEPPPATPAGAPAPSEANTRPGAPMRSLQSEMDLPSNIPYPGIAERAAQAATPSTLYQTPSMPGSADPGREDAGAAARLSAAARARSLQGASRLQGSAQALLTPFRNSTRRERIAESPSAASLATAPGARVAPPSTPGSEARYGLGIPGIARSPDPSRSPELGARTPESSIRSPTMGRSPSAYGTPITATPAVTASPAPPPVDPGVRAAMRKMSDALPDADEGTLLTYLGRCNGDSYRAIVRIHCIAGETNGAERIPTGPGIRTGRVAEPAELLLPPRSLCPVNAWAPTARGILEVDRVKVGKDELALEHLPYHVIHKLLHLAHVLEHVLLRLADAAVKGQVGQDPLRCPCV